MEKAATVLPAGRDGTRVRNDIKQIIIENVKKIIEEFAVDENGRAPIVEKMRREERRFYAACFRATYKYDSNIEVTNTCIWPRGSYTWPGKCYGVTSVGVHGADSICVVTMAENLDMTRVSGSSGEWPKYDIMCDLRRSAIYDIEVLTDPSRKSFKNWMKHVQKPFGVVSVMQEGSDEGYDEQKAVEFLKEEFSKEAGKSTTAFCTDITVQTAISALQHLCKKEFKKANEIEVSLMDPRYKKNSYVTCYKDFTIEELESPRIRRYLAAINKPDLKGDPLSLPHPLPPPGWDGTILFKSKFSESVENELRLRGAEIFKKIKEELAEGKDGKPSPQRAQRIAKMHREDRKINAACFRAAYKYDSKNNEETKTCIWPRGSHSWRENFSGVTWVGLHGADSICVVTTVESLDMTRVSGSAGEGRYYNILRDFRKSVIHDIEVLADPSSKPLKECMKSIKKPFGVVCVIRESSDEVYDEQKATEFLKKAVKSYRTFGIDKTVQTAISALQHLCKKEFKKANEIEVSLMDPRYEVNASERCFKDFTIEEVDIQDITRYLANINTPDFKARTVTAVATAIQRFNTQIIGTAQPSMKEAMDAIWNSNFVIPVCICLSVWLVYYTGLLSNLKSDDI